MRNAKGEAPLIFSHKCRESLLVMDESSYRYIRQPVCLWLHRGHTALAVMWRWWNTVCAVCTVLCRSFRRSIILLSTRLAREGPRRGSLSSVSKLKVSFNSVCCECCCVAAVCRNCQQNTLLPWKQTAQVSLSHIPDCHTHIHSYVH